MKKLLVLVTSLALLMACGGPSLSKTFEGDGFTVKYSEKVSIVDAGSTAFFVAKNDETGSSLNIMKITDFAAILGDMSSIEKLVLQSIPAGTEATEFKNVKIAGLSGREITITVGELTQRTVLLESETTLFLIQSSTKTKDDAKLFNAMIKSLKVTTESK